MVSCLPQQPRGVAPCGRRQQLFYQRRHIGCRAAQIEQSSPQQSFLESSADEESGFSTDDGAGGVGLAERLVAAGARGWPPLQLHQPNASCGT